jgi:hypothetical protein
MRSQYLLSRASFKEIEFFDAKSRSLYGFCLFEIRPDRAHSVEQLIGDTSAHARFRGEFLAKVENVTREPERALAEFDPGRVLHANDCFNDRASSKDLQDSTLTLRAKLPFGLWDA